MDEFAYSQVFFFGLAQHGFQERFVREPAGAAQGVLNEGGTEATGEGVGSGGDDVPEAEIVLKGRSFVKGGSGIDGPGLLRFGIGFTGGVCGLVTVLSAPLACRIKVLQTESNRVDLAVALGSLRILLMQRDPFRSGELFV